MLALRLAQAGRLRHARYRHGFNVLSRRRPAECPATKR